ncbi:MAG: AarF/ABC1/UbiB kinase family protein [Anaerolineae bacterium]|nr:AarF/ABC1/UbiB kinase family protein [Anaerolineae bacterium]
MSTLSSLRPIRHLGRYRQIAGVFFKHGFGFIFDHLGPEWRPSRRAFRQRPQEPGLASGDLAAHFRQALEELGPTFVKLGQILSTRPDLLPLPYIAELSKLCDTVPPEPWGAVHQVLVEEYGREPEEIFDSIGRQPIAAASLAQVHIATLPGGEEVVIKVQRPNILATISTDLEILMELARAARPTTLGQIYDFVAIAEDFSFTLRSELDYRREGRNADRFRANFVDEQYLYIPHVYWDLSTPRVLVQERIQGIKIDDVAALDAAGYDRHEIALHCAHIVVKEVLEDSFFHADPHPGNLVVMPGGMIGAMDFGMVGHLSERDRRNLIRLYYVSVTLDADGIVEQLIRMGAAGTEVNRPVLARDIGRLLVKYHGLPLRDIRAQEVVEEIMPIAFRHRLRLPSDLWLLGKTLATMEGVGLHLDPDFDLFEISEPIVQKLIWQMVLPRQDWVQILLRYGAGWADLLGTLPRTGSRLLERAEEGDLFQIRLKDADPIMSRLDRLATRLALSVLIAALIISLALLVPLMTTDSPLQLPVAIGFVLALGLGVWLLISILRGTK